MPNRLLGTLLWGIHIERNKGACGLYKTTRNEAQSNSAAVFCFIFKWNKVEWDVLYSLLLWIEWRVRHDGNQGKISNVDNLGIKDGRTKNKWLEILKIRQRLGIKLLLITSLSCLASGLKPFVGSSPYQQWQNAINFTSTEMALLPFMFESPGAAQDKGK